MKRTGLYTLAALMLLFCGNLDAQSTYYNPLNLDYGIKTYWSAATGAPGPEAIKTD